MLPYTDAAVGLTMEPTKDAEFAQAQCHWRALGADRRRWVEPGEQRALAAAFLRYHAAKLATGGRPAEVGGMTPRVSHRRPRGTLGTWEHWTGRRPS